MRDEKIARIFNVTLPNALDTTFTHAGWDDTFVITGDIPAMWLRDATFQVMPYLRFVADDPPLSAAMCGLLKRQAKSILLDPYANAFNFNASGQGHQSDKRIPKMTPAVFEGKYELDSLVAFLKLGNAYWSRARAEDSRRCLQPTAASREGPSGSDDWFLRTVWVVLETLRVQQRGSEEDSMHPVQYAFWRSENDLGNNGTGYPSRRTGMIKSAFRPSDDPTTFPFNIPSNWFAVTELRRLNATLTEMGGKGMREAAAEAASIAEDVARGIEAFGSAANPANALEKILVYETDGFGNTLFMDDANAPSVLSIPYLSPEGAQSPIFAASRAFSLSPSNPFYFRGKVGSGVGGP